MACLLQSIQTSSTGTAGAAGMQWTYTQVTAGEQRPCKCMHNRPLLQAHSCSATGEQDGAPFSSAFTRGREPCTASLGRATFVMWLPRSGWARGAWTRGCMCERASIVELRDAGTAHILYQNIRYALTRDIIARLDHRQHTCQRQNCTCMHMSNCMVLHEIFCTSKQVAYPDAF